MELSGMPSGLKYLDLVIYLTKGPSPNAMKYQTVECITYTDLPLNNSSVSTQTILKKTYFSNFDGQLLLFDENGDRLPEPEVDKSRILQA